MSFLTYIFPVAAIAFVLITAWSWLPLLRGGRGDTALTDGPGVEAELLSATRPSKKRFSFSYETHPVTGRDRLLMLAVTLIYAVVAFINLGDRSAPESYYEFPAGGSAVVIELPEEASVSAIRYYGGLRTGSYTLAFSTDGETYTDTATMEQNYVALFKWKDATFPDDTPRTARYIRITASAQLQLRELAVYDGDGERMEPDTLGYPAEAAALFDEQAKIPESQSFMNSTYFDEIYHARTALEHLENVQPYEISHPPLGKIIIGVGISLFGMNPFGWRFMGTLFGVLMLPLMYIFLKKLFGRTDIAVCGTVIFASDFMHFAQTRIATIDTYSVFFILLMYLFMWRFVSGGRLWNLALSGLFFGLGAASKWTCIYAGAGLAVIWLVYWVSRRGEEDFVREFFANVFFCIIFFVLVPVFVYYLSYYPYGTARGMSGLSMLASSEYAGIVWRNQVYMWEYHSDLVSTHPYSSSWYLWLVNGRPILYYLEYFGDGTKSAIGAFLNPLLCWGGLFAIIGAGILAFKQKSAQGMFILIGYLAQLLPWVLVSRLTFAYHYFPSSVFLILALGLMWSESERAALPKWRNWMLGFTGASVALFAAFYPVLSGLRVSAKYCSWFLKWIPSWPF